ncbi:cellulose synthase family protein [Solirubrum puertoriconensis]|uniref:Histidine kinase n=1 Tax=Solirubrum puertoriconensis TaxID=1751427 RepID=A0A9X0HKG2_SOLP1|nr:cellulose synthase family protein [Solirubrum puertoriconensis]KUG07547.1 histidine kinase [Solirubrum puertoriconensis]
MNGLEVAVLALYGLCLLLVFGFSLAQLALTLLARHALRQPEPAAPALPTSPDEWPRVTVQLPIYNEINVVERIIDAAAALQYPPARLQIQVLDDSTDESVALAAARVASYLSQGMCIEHVRRATRSGYKAGALAHGLQTATGELVAIFDADFVPPADFLLRTVPYFTDAQVGMVQTRWGHLNEEYSLLTELQAFGLNAHFLVEQTGRLAGHHFINFNGTGGIWRRSCIADAGGWQADTLTEDLDLSYRAQLRGWQFRYLPTVVAPAELPAEMPALRSQQYRWNKGAAENARKHLARVWQHPGLSIGTKLHATVHLLNSSVFVAVLLMALLSVPLLWVRARNPALQWPFWVAGFSVLSLLPLAGFYYVAWRHNGGRGTDLLFGPKFLLFLTVSMGLSWHNAWAVLAGWGGRRTPFVRTPKLGLVHRNNMARQRYLVRNSAAEPLVLEGLLAVYFGAGLALGIHYEIFGLMPFHLMLLVGYGAVVYYSVLHTCRS